MAARPLELFHPAVRTWFTGEFPAPTKPQQLGWPAIARGESTLILAPTGSGKTLTAFLWCLNRLLFEPVPPRPERCRVLYVSPLKALAVDIERNLRMPLAGIADVAVRAGLDVAVPQVAIRTGDTPAGERARFLRSPADILITTPESLFLLLTSNARERLASVDTVIVDEIHALVPTKRGAHLALSLERLEALGGKSLQRIGLSATQRPLDEVARFLGGAQARRATGRRREPAKDAAARDVHNEFAADDSPAFRPVTIVNASGRKGLELTIEVPVEERRLEDSAGSKGSKGPEGGAARSIWSSIYPRLLELIQSHRSTLIFVNSRRLAERLAGAMRGRWA